MRAQKTITKHLILTEDECIELEDIVGKTYKFDVYTDKINLSLRTSKLGKKVDFSTSYFITYEPVLNQDNTVKVMVSLFHYNSSFFKKHFGLIGGTEKAVKYLFCDNYIGQYVFKHDGTLITLVVKSKEQKTNIFNI